MQVAAIPTGPTYYQPVSAVPPVAPVKGQPSDGSDGGASQKVRPTPPSGVGTLLDIQA
ncbi:MAG TPA: hypothetical protein VNW53_06355 [Phenylobacterium sp.]|uniref:hypothetical protein n=1 Tax=Phenylobacterium sp. TaxID=1871053 RepID=UPI002B6A420D|nr:hypothetical protein [Phenylobacterium sp.]HXA38604.1 hypothetical protein [Phenylobacterium sp.]